MKFATTILTLALAALTMATPLANPSPVADPVAAPQITPPPVDKPNCRDCDNNYTKCRLVSTSFPFSPPCSTLYFLLIETCQIVQVMLVQPSGL
jgi:hypothetical protein